MYSLFILPVGLWGWRNHIDLGVFCYCPDKGNTVYFWPATDEARRSLEYFRELSPAHIRRPWFGSYYYMDISTALRLHAALTSDAMHHECVTTYSEALGAFITDT